MGKIIFSIPGLNLRYPYPVCKNGKYDVKHDCYVNVAFLQRCLSVGSFQVCVITKHLEHCETLFVQ